jgi:transposase-like protein
MEKPATGKNPLLHKTALQSLSMAHLAPLLASTEIRSLSRAQRAVSLVTEYKVPQKAVAKHFGMSTFALSRAIKSVTQNRQIGVNGRPPLLTSTEQEALAQWIKEQAELNQPVTIKQCKDKVNTITINPVRTF